jgi:hypothetical protein
MTTSTKTPVGLNPVFVNKLIESLTEQRNHGFNAWAETQATLAVVSQENQFLTKRVAELEEALSKLQSEGVGVTSAATALPGVTARSEAERKGQLL